MAGRMLLLLGLRLLRWLLPWIAAASLPSLAMPRTLLSALPQADRWVGCCYLSGTLFLGLRSSPFFVGLRLRCDCFLLGALGIG